MARPARRGLLAAALCALLLAASALDFSSRENDYETDTDRDVAALTADNFDASVKAVKYALVELYAPWCGHCKSLAPEYAAAATALKASKPDVLLAKVDATVETALATRFDVQGFPTLKWFVDGELAGDYTGGRTSAELVQWVTKKTSDPLKALASAADADAFRSEAGLYAVVALVADVGGKEATALRQAAVALDETFGLTTEASVAKHMGMADAKAPALAVVKSFDEPLVIMEEAFTADAITAFVKKYSRPLTIPFSQANARMIFKSTHQVLTIAPAEGIEDVLTALRAAALALRGSGLQFVTVDPADADVGQVLTFFGVDAGITAPVVKGFSTTDGKVNKFNMPAGDITATSLEAFARSLLDGTAAPTYNSAPAPEVNDGPVTIVTGNTFDQIVLDTTKDVLLEVYAPWCGHCKQLEPIYEKLGKRFAAIDSVVIAKMDGTVNEHPAAQAQGYPTLLFFPAMKAGADAQGPGVPYEGERTLKALTKFIKQHATVPYSLPLKKSAQQEADEDEGAESLHDELR